MISPGEAWRRLLPSLAPLTGERLARRRAGGRVLAEAVDATVDAPPCDVSAMDGFAIRGDSRALGSWPVTGLVAAGDRPGRRLADGEAVRIMTGAPVPPPADRIVPVEEASLEEDAGGARVRFTVDAAPGAHIRRRGEVIRSGEPLLPAGTLLTPAAVSHLASHGYAEVVVHRAPRVAVLATGDEVVPPELVPEPGQLRDSNTDFLLAAGAAMGLELEPLGIAPDEPEGLRRLMAAGLERDVLLVCGGVSMGELDFVEDVLDGLGCELLFDSVAVQPGKPLVAARHPRGLVFGLPGNPASVMVSFWLFVRPALRRLLGLDDGYWHGAVTAELAAQLPGAKGRDRFLAAEVEFADGRMLVTPLPPKGSHDVAAYAGGTAIVRVPAGAEPLAAGGRCEILPLVDWRLPRRRSSTDGAL